MSNTVYLVFDLGVSADERVQRLDRASTMQAADALALLQWLGEELAQLPRAKQAEALRLPLLLGGKLSSRVAARALRALLLPPQAAPRSAPSAPSSAQDEPAVPGRSAVSRVQSPRCLLCHAVTP